MYSVSEETAEKKSSEIEPFCQYLGQEKKKKQNLNEKLISKLISSKKK